MTGIPSGACVVDDAAPATAAFMCSTAGTSSAGAAEAGTVDSMSTRSVDRLLGVEEV